MRISSRTTIILGIVIVLLMMTQFLFTPPSESKRVKYVRPGNITDKDKGTRTKPYHDLQNAIDKCDDGDTLMVLQGTYEAHPEYYVEELCGNCEEHLTQVIARRGFIIADKQLTILGAGVDRSTIITNAGYGLLFHNSGNSTIKGLTVTGGVRNTEEAATDAGIVLKFSSVTIRDCKIVDNTHQLEDVVVGIGGIMVREGSVLHAINNEISNNGWDGIALYRGATAFIEGNVIYKGRGAGIGVTWDAEATIINNHIYEYWKGIGSFGDSRVICRDNIVRDCLGWGIIATGTSYMDAVNNVVYHNGNCGMATWSDEASGRFSNNIITLNGWKEQWVAPQVGIQNYGGYENFIISHNCVWNNVSGNYNDMPDLTGKNGNISVDPLFIDPSLGDFRLNNGSSCIDAGNPLITDTDGTVSDIGLSSGKMH